MPDEVERPSNELFQFEHRCPDGVTIVLGDSPDGIGEYVHAPHLGGAFATKVFTLKEFRDMRPSAFEAPVLTQTVASGEQVADAVAVDAGGDFAEDDD